MEPNIKQGHKDHEELSEILAHIKRIDVSLGHLNREVTTLRLIHFVTINDLNHVKKEILMQIQEVTDALVALSTASDSLSLSVDALATATTTTNSKLDHLITDVAALIVAIKANVPSVPQPLTDAVNKAQASASALVASKSKADAAAAAVVAAGDAVDQAVTDADGVLPSPAPAGTISSKH